MSGDGKMQKVKEVQLTLDLKKKMKEEKRETDLAQSQVMEKHEQTLRKQKQW